MKGERDTAWLAPAFKVLLNPTKESDVDIRLQLWHEACVNDTPAKVFRVSITNFEDSSHVTAILKQLRKSFHHRVQKAEPSDPSAPLICMVKCENKAALLEAISSAVGNDKLVAGEMSWTDESGTLTSVPWDCIKFYPPSEL